MSHQTLPYLHCLKTTINNLSAAASADPGAAMQAAVASRLLDHMMVQRIDAPILKAECYATLLKLLPEIEAAIEAAAGKLSASSPALTSAAITPDVEKMPLGNGAAGALHELKAICTASDISAFDRFLQLGGEVQRSLFALNTPQALALCKSIVQIEADYSRQFEAAVVAHGAASSAEGKAGSGARNARAYDEQALLAFIRKTFPQETEVGIVQSGFVSGGYSKFTVSITLSNAKSLPEQIILRGDASATFGGVSVVDEYRLIKTMYENGVCVPQPLALEETGKVFGSPFLLVAKKSGNVIGHMFNLPKTPNKTTCEDVGAKLAAIHRVPLAAIGTQIDGVNTPSSAKALAWIEEGFNNWQPLNMPSPVFEIAFEWLRRHAGINDKAPRKLVHGDYGLNNLLIDNDRVSTILDWEFAHVGNPAYDLGYFYFMAQSLYSWEYFLESFGKAGMPIPDEEQLNYNILLAATRLGVMVCQTSGVFTSGAEPGLAGAAVVGGNFYEETIKRISGALQRVL